MRKRTASRKSPSCWRLSFWRFSIGFRIITALFHISSIHKVFDFMNTRFLFCILGLCTEQTLLRSALFCYADFGYVRYSIETPCRILAV